MTYLSFENQLLIFFNHLHAQTTEGSLGILYALKLMRFPVFVFSFGLCIGSISNICDRIVDAILIALDDMIPKIDEQYLQRSRQMLIEQGKPHHDAIFVLDGKHCHVRATPISFHSYKYQYGGLQLQILVNRATAEIAALSAGFYASQHDVEMRLFKSTLQLNCIIGVRALI